MNLRWLWLAVLLNWVGMLFVACGEVTLVAFFALVLIGSAMGLLVGGLNKLGIGNKFHD